MNFNIRDATIEDTGALNDISNWYIENTAIHFDNEIWSLEKRRKWIESFNQPGSPYKMLVGESDGKIIGFSNNTVFRPRAAYNPSTETTVYIAHDVESRGRGGKLYAALLDLVARENFHRAYAVITLPNPASVALHQRLGFKRVGILDEVGKKFGQFHDAAMYQKKF